MNTQNNEKINPNTNETNEEVPHVHGPNCNHGHTALKPIVRTTQKVGRNDPCPCGSQKKYKKCCADL